MDYHYRDLKPRTTFLCGLLYILAALDVAALISNHIERGVLLSIADMTSENADAIKAAAERSDFWQKAIAFPTLALTLVTFVVGGMWIYRAAANLRALGATRLEFTPGWAVGWYAVPFANLIKPFQAMNEIWRASRDPQRWDAQSTPLDLRVWWGLWLVSCILGRFAMQMTLHAEKPAELLDANALQTACDVVGLPLNLLFAHIVLRIGGMQAAHPAPELAPPALPEAA